jgi:parallel beta-helix repeat protein
VEGGANANGGEDTTIVFKGLIKENATGVEIYKSNYTPNFNFCRFENLTKSITSNEKKIIINNCKIINNERAISLYKCNKYRIESSNFDNNEYAVKISFTDSDSDTSALINNNSFTGGGNICIEIIQSNQIKISNNSIKNYYTGIHVYIGSNPIIVHNEFQKNIRHIYYIGWSTGRIQNNNFQGGNNLIYIEHAADPEITYNNLYDCEEYKIKIGRFDQEFTINAMHNWWGTTDTTIVNFYILDREDDTYQVVGKVEYIPIEYQEISDCGILTY